MTKALTIASRDKLLQAITAGEGYPRDRRALADFLRERGGGITEETLKDYAQAVAAEAVEKARGASWETNRIAGMKKAVKELLAHAPEISAAVRDGVLRTLGEIKIPKRERTEIPREKLFTREEIDRLIAEIPDRRLSLLVAALYQTGCRESELLQARSRALREEGDHYTLTVRGKGNKERKVFMSSALVAEIREMFGVGTLLFPGRDGKVWSASSVSHRIRRASKHYIGKTLSPHAFRHSKATHLIEAGRALNAVSRFLGHSSVDVTAKFYLHNQLQADDVL